MTIRQSKAMYQNQVYFDKLRKRGYHSKEHARNAESIEQRFFDAIAAHPVIGHLADFIRDPIAHDQQIRRLYVTCRGIITDGKKEVLNAALCIFGETLVRKEYQGVDISQLLDEERAKVSQFVC